MKSIESHRQSKCVLEKKSTLFIVDGGVAVMSMASILDSCLVILLGEENRNTAADFSGD